MIVSEIHAMMLPDPDLTTVPIAELVIRTSVLLHFTGVKVGQQDVI